MDAYDRIARMTADEQLFIFDHWLAVGFVDLTEYNRLVSGIVG